MCRIKARIVKGGGESIAYIKTADGLESQVVIVGGSAGRHHIVAAEIGRDRDRVLVELPQETATGDWRIWVKKTQVLRT